MYFFKNDMLSLGHSPWLQMNYYVTKIRGANLHLDWAELTVLFSRQSLNGTQDLFSVFYALILIYFLKYETIETHAPVFLSHNNSSVARVHSLTPGHNLTPGYTLTASSMGDTP